MRSSCGQMPSFFLLALFFFSSQRASSSCPVQSSFQTSIQLLIVWFLQWESYINILIIEWKAPFHMLSWHKQCLRDLLYVREGYCPLVWYKLDSSVFIHAQHTDTYCTDSYSIYPSHCISVYSGEEQNWLWFELSLFRAEVRLRAAVNTVT